MRRFALVIPLTLALGVGAVASSVSCATYRDDLQRARAHYDKNEYEKALALFRVLEPDLDSLSDAEQAQFAYSRGMTDYRLAGLAEPGNAAKDPKREFRAHARHWLGVAQAIEKLHAGSLQADEKTRLEESLADLNKDVFGGGESMDADGGAPDAAPPAPPAPAKGK